MMTMHTVYLLAGSTMAVFRIQWLLPAQLVLDLPAMAATLIASMEVWVILVDLVGGSVLPLIKLAVCTPIITIITVGSVCRGVRHGFGAGMELNPIKAGDGSRCWIKGTCRGAEVG
jgi:hypothetical protein